MGGYFLAQSGAAQKNRPEDMTNGPDRYGRHRTDRPAQGRQNRRGGGRKVARRNRSTHKDVKNEGTSGDLHENTGRKTICPAKKATFMHVYAPSYRKTRVFCGDRRRSCKKSRAKRSHRVSARWSMVGGNLCFARRATAILAVPPAWAGRPWRVLAKFLERPLSTLAQRVTAQF